MDFSIRVRVEERVRAVREVSILANLILEGVWSGRARPGAQLVARPSFEDRALLRLIDTGGITLRNLALDAMSTPGVSCLVIQPPAGAVSYMQCIAVRRCTFAGEDASLVELGPPLSLVAPAQLPDEPPIARWSNYGADTSGAAIDECEFRPQGRSVALAVRTSQSVPFRVRDCSFVGDADAMIKAWEGTFLVERCSFENRRHPAGVHEEVPGYELPDGVDIYLLNEPALDAGNTPASLGLPRPPGRIFTDTLAAVTATGCVSRSPTFLGTTSVPRGGGQYTRWPVLLLNVRHVPTNTDPSATSIRWALKGGGPALVSAIGGRPDARLGAAAALVVLGGQYGGALRALRALERPAPIVVIGARGLGASLLSEDIPRPSRGVLQPSDLFGLRVDQVRR